MATCNICGQTYKTERGVKQHITRSHNRKERAPVIINDNSDWNDALARKLLLHHVFEGQALKEFCTENKANVKKAERFLKKWKARAQSTTTRPNPNLRQEYQYEEAHPVPLSMGDFTNYGDDVYPRRSGQDPALRQRITAASTTARPKLRTSKLKQEDWDKVRDRITERYVFLPEQLPSDQWCDFETRVDQFTTEIYDAINELSKHSVRKGKSEWQLKLDAHLTALKLAKKELKRWKKALLITQRRLIGNTMKAPVLRSSTKRKLRSLTKGWACCGLLKLRMRAEDRREFMECLVAMVQTAAKVASRARRRIRRARKAKGKREETEEYLRNRGRFYSKHGSEPITADNPPTVTQVQQYHTSITSSKNGTDEDLYKLAPRWLREVLTTIPGADTEPYMWDITNDKVTKAVKAAGKTAPGADGIGFDVWKNLGVEETLTGIFETCRLSERIPASWKDGIAIPLPKKANVTEAKDYRLVILQRSIYKLFASITASDLLAFSEENTLINPNQRAYRKSISGTMWNCWLVREALADLTRNRSGIAIVTFYDIANAFGSVEHDQLLIVMERLGVPGHVLRLLTFIMDNTMFRVRMDEDTSEPVWQDKGLKQGDALSALLFLYILEPIARISARDSICYRMKSDSSIAIHNQSFSDDLATLTNSAGAVDRFLYYFQSYLAWAKMEAHPSKSCTMAWKYSQRSALTFNPDLVMGETPVRTLREGETNEKYLGVLFNDSHSDDANVKKVEGELLRRLIKLSTWNLEKRLAAQCIKEWALPAVQYPMPLIRIPIATLRDWDRKVRMTLKQHLSLEENTASGFIHCKAHGGLGVPSMVDVYYKSKIRLFMDVINNGSPSIRDVAWHSLLDTANGTRLWIDNKSTLSADCRETFGDVSFWAQVKSAIVHFDLRVYKDHNDAVYLTNATSDEPIKWKDYIKELCERRHLEAWTKLPMAGYYPSKVPDNALQWPIKCNFTTWNIMMQGRASTLHTRALLKIEGITDSDICSHCNIRDTQKHVFNNCGLLLHLYKLRHDNALKVMQPFIQSALKANEVLVWDRHCPRAMRRSLGRLDHDRPDVLIVNTVTKAVTLLELTICYDSNFVKSTEEKVRKYQDLMEDLRKAGYKPTLGVIAIGSLGTLVPEALESLALVLTEPKAKRCLQKMAASAIVGSAMVWQSYA